MITFPYELDHGERVYGDPIQLGQGLSSQILRSGRSMRFGTSEDQMAHGAVLGTYTGHVRESTNESWLGVPIKSGEETIGLVVFGDDKPNYFSEADERLVSTIVSSMGVALENARLFEQTNTLLAETKERAAELAIVNSVQLGLGANLDMQAMYELVGDKIAEIFDAQVVDIGLYDVESDIVRYPYSIERGVRFPDEPRPIRGFGRIVLDTRAPILVNDVQAWEAERGESDSRRAG